MPPSAATTGPADSDYDLIVAGAGCAGMATALFAAIQGLKVLVLEASPWVGGTSALAAGALWIPNTHLAAGSGDTPAKAANYLAHATGDSSPAALREAFLRWGPEAVHCLERETDVQLRAFAHHPDYLSDLPDATTWGRVLECLPFDGRRLGSALALVRPPIPEFTVLGGMMVDRIDIGHLLGMSRSWASFSHALRLLLRHAADRLRHPRGTRWVLGNALVGRLLLSLRQRDVPVWTQAEAQELVSDGARVTGVRVLHQGRLRTLHARVGVVLAGGGFNANPELRRQLIPSEVRYSPRAEGGSGRLLQQAISLGARLGAPGGSAAFWAPVSVRRRGDGSCAVFPHFVLDRAKPGTVVVNAQGQRFVNESTSYHLFGERMLQPTQGSRPDAQAYLVADARALAQYGLGMIRPGGRGLRRFLREGYVVQGRTIPELADRLGLPAEGLMATVARMNEFARTGVDTDFQRGSTAYQRNLGDPAVQPNPTLRPFEAGPFYAVRLHAGDIGASVGLVTDGHARVLRSGQPIEGLYAVGNDMQSVMGAAYPGPGINLGPAVVFAYAAAEAATRASKEAAARTA